MLFVQMAKNVGKQQMNEAMFTHLTIHWQTVHLWLHYAI